MKKLQRIVSLILVLAMVIGLLPSMSRVYATGDEGDNYQLILRKGYYDENEKVFSLDLYIKNTTFFATELSYKYPNDMIEVINYKTFENRGIIEEAETISQAVKDNKGVTGAVLDGISDLQPGIIHEFISITANNGNDLAYDSSDKETLISRTYFHIIDENLELFELTNSLFDIDSESYFALVNEDRESNEDTSIFKVEGFIEDNIPDLSEISIKTNPTEGQTYEHGDEIDLQGGRILATYSDDSTDEISMMDANVTVTTGEQEGAVADIDCPTITFTYGGKTVDMNVTVVDPVVKVEFDDAGMAEAFNDYGGIPVGTDLMENPDIVEALEDATITVTTKSGKQTTSNLMDLIESGDVTLSTTVARNDAGVQVITITYKDNTDSETTYSIIVGDSVANIAIAEGVDAPETEFKVNDTFEKSGKIIVYGANSGEFDTKIDMATDTVKVTDMEGNEVDLSTPGSKQLLVTYLGKTATYTINVANTVEDIRINKSINTTYNQALTQADLAEVTVTEVLADGTDGETKAMQLAWLDTSTYNSTKFTSQNIRVNYPTEDGTVRGTLVAKVQDALTAIRIENLNKEVEYGKDIDYEGAELYVKYLSGEMGPFAIDDDTLTSTLVNTTMGEQDVTFTYNDGVETTTNPTPIKLTVVKAEPELPDVELLEVIENQPVSTIAAQLPAVDFGELVWVNPNDSVADGVTKDVAVRYVIDSAHQANYKDTEFTVAVKGVEKEITSVRLQAIPDEKLEYYDTQKFDTSTIIINATYNDPENPTGNIVSGYKLLNSTDENDEFDINEPLSRENGETKTIYVKYGNFDAMPLTVTIKPDELRSINVIANDAKVKYAYGEDLNLTGATVEKVMASGNNTEIAIDAEGVVIADTFNKTSVSSQQIQVTYQEKTDYITVQVEDYVERIEIPAETLAALKTTYNYGETKKVSDSSNALYINTYKASAPETAVPVEITTDMISLDTTKLGAQEAKITYTGIVKNEEYTLEKTYTINVNDYITGIEIETLPDKVLYNIDEVFAKDGLKVRNVMASEATGDKTNTTLAENEYTLSAVSTATAGKKEITVTKTETGDTATFTILVLDGTEELELAINQAPTNKQYYGKALDLTGGKVLVKVKNSDVGTIVPMTDSRVSVEGYDAETLGKQTLAVKYANGTDILSTTMDVVVANYRLEELVLTAPTKTEYIWGEALDLTGGQVARTMANGTLFAVSPLTQEMVEGYSATTEGEQTITVSYADLEATYTVNVIDTVESVTMKTYPTLEYNYGQDLNLSGATIEVKKVSGTYTYPVTSDMISTYNKTQEGTQRITVTYGELTTYFDVTVTDHDYGIRMVEGTYKTAYNYGEALDLTGTQIEHVKDSAVEPINVTSAMVSGYSATTEGEQTITVKYTDSDSIEHTTTFVVTVTDHLNNVTLKSAPTNTENSYGHAIDLTGAKITLHKDSGNTDIDITSEMVSGYNATTEGTQAITVSHAGFTLNNAFNVTVVDHILGIALKSSPTKLTYKIGDSIDLAGAEITVTKDSGNTDTAMTLAMISGFDTTTDGTKTITVSYEGFTAADTFDVVVFDNVNGIELKSAPTNTENSYGHAIDLTGAKLTLLKDSGNKEIDIVEAMISGYNKNAEGTYPISVTYGEFTLTDAFTVTVVDHILGIEMKPNTYKTEYNYGQALDLTDTFIIFHKDSGNTDVAVTSDMVSGYSATTEGAQTLTVTYQGQVATFDVTVTDHVNSIDIQTLPTNTENSYGHAINLEGATIIAHKDSGDTAPIAVTSTMVSGYNANQTGTQTITVTYEGKQVTFDVTVVDHILGIEMKANTYKTDYKYGETLDLTGTKIIFKKDSGNTEVAVTSAMVEGYSATTEGNQRLTVTYEGAQTTFDVTVTDHVYGIAMKSNPDKTQYNWGEEFEVAGTKVEYKKDSATTVLDVTDDMISGYNKNKAGMQAITVTYTDDKGDDYTTTFNVEVIDRVKEVELVSAPTKVEYEYGENLNLAGATISIEKDSGTTQIPVTSAMVSGFDSKTAGKQTLTVTYEGKEVTFEITIKEKKEEPVVEPSVEPSPAPTTEPTVAPTTAPTTKPTSKPTQTPTVRPTVNPVIDVPTTTPVVSPSIQPSAKPTSEVTSSAKVSQRPTQTLAQKDKNESEVKDTIIPAVIGLVVTGALLLLVLAATKKNVEVYAIVAGERKLLGRKKINKNTKVISLDEYSDEIGDSDVQVVIDSKVSNKMAGEDIKIELNNKSTKCKIEASEDEEYTIEIKK